MKLYIVKPHRILGQYTNYGVTLAPWVSSDSYDCFYLEDDYCAELYIVADLSEEDLIVLTLSGCLYTTIVTHDQLSRHILYKLDIL